jgi:hypothetical protein
MVLAELKTTLARHRFALHEQALTVEATKRSGCVFYRGKMVCYEKPFFTLLGGKDAKSRS